TCASSKLCLASDGTDGVFASTNPAARRDRWHLVLYAEYPTFTSLACAPRGLCTAGDDSGDLWTSRDPARRHSWKRAPVDRAGVVSGDSGQVDVTGVSCPDVSFCAAVDGAGRVLESSDPAGGRATWTATHLGGPQDS